MRKRIEPTFLEQAIETDTGSDLVFNKLEQQVALKSHSKNTLHNYICRIASIFMLKQLTKM
jgi:hypothetical protein